MLLGYALPIIMYYPSNRTDFTQQRSTKYPPFESKQVILSMIIVGSEGIIFRGWVLLNDPPDPKTSRKEKKEKTLTLQQSSSTSQPLQQIDRDSRRLKK